MTRLVRLSVLAVASAALVACGGGAKLGGGKEGAAQAFFEASQPAGKNSAQGSAMQRLASGVTLGAETVACTHGGSVKLSLDLSSFDSTDTDSASFGFDLEYDDCNEDGVNEYDGKMKMLFDFAGTPDSAFMSLRFKGKININGEIDDHLEVDITQSVSLVDMGAATGSVTVKLKGTIKTSQETHTYNDEAITITVGGALPAEVDGNS